MAAFGLVCGVWPGRKGLSAVLVDTADGGTAARPALRMSCASPESRLELLQHIDATHGLDWQLILPDWLARADLLADFAQARGVPVWTVPPHVVEAVRILGHLDALPAHRVAAALARVLCVPLFRTQLRRLRPPDPRQLSLF